MNLDLNRFIIFNPSEGQDEGREHDKLIYHWTKDKPNNKTDLSEQIDDVCLCDASITTSERLGLGLLRAQECGGRVSGNEGHNDECTGENRCLVVTFDPTVIVIVEVEPESSIWIAVHVAHTQITEGGDQLATNHKHDPESIPAEAVKQLVRNIYERFCLINGTFQMITHSIQSSTTTVESQKASAKDQISSLCDIYFSSVLAALHLSSIINNVASLYNYLIYLDLNPYTFMKITSFINHVVCVDPTQIRHTIAIFNDHLLWSSMNSYDSRQVFNYLVTVLIREALQEELTREVDKVRRISEDAILHLTDDLDYGRDLDTTHTAPTNTGPTKTRKFYRYFITVFRSSNNLTLGLILREPGQVDLIQKCEQLLTSDTRLGVVPLASLAKSVGQNYIKTNQVSGGSLSAAGSQSASSTSRRKQVTSGPTPPSSTLGDQRYLCFDHLSSSVINNFSPDTISRDPHLLSESVNMELPNSRKQRLVKCVLDLEPDLHDMEQQLGCQVEEYLAKTTNDNWITVTNSKFRCIYSIYKMRNAGLNEARQSAMNLKLKLITSQPSCA